MRVQLLLDLVDALRLPARQRARPSCARYDQSRDAADAPAAFATGTLWGVTGSIGGIAELAASYWVEVRLGSLSSVQMGCLRGRRRGVQPRDRCERLRPPADHAGAGAALRRRHHRGAGGQPGAAAVPLAD